MYFADKLVLFVTEVLSLYQGHVDHYALLDSTGWSKKVIPPVYRAARSCSRMSSVRPSVRLWRWWIV